MCVLGEWEGLPVQKEKKGRQEEGSRKIKERWRPQMKIACVFFMADISEWKAWLSLTSSLCSSFHLQQEIKFEQLREAEHVSAFSAGLGRLHAGSSLDTAADNSCRPRGRIPVTGRTGSWSSLSLSCSELLASDLQQCSQTSNQWNFSRVADLFDGVHCCRQEASVSVLRGQDWSETSWVTYGPLWS